MASDFQDQFREAMREAEVADLKRQFDEASAKATSAFNNPLETAQKEVEAAFGSEPKPAKPTAAIEPPIRRDRDRRSRRDRAARRRSASARRADVRVAEPPRAAADAPLDIRPDSASPAVAHEQPQPGRRGRDRAEQGAACSIT